MQVLKQRVFYDATNGLIFEEVPVYEEKQHAQYKLNYTMLRNDGLREINCGKRISEYNIATTAWERFEKSIV